MSLDQGGKRWPWRRSSGAHRRTSPPVPWESTRSAPVPSPVFDAAHHPRSGSMLGENLTAGSPEHLRRTADTDHTSGKRWAGRLPVCPASASLEGGFSRPALMISSFSDAEYLIRRRHHPRSCIFFKQPVLEHLFSNNLLQIKSLTAQITDFIGIGAARRITGKPTPASLHEVIGRWPPSVPAICNTRPAQYPHGGIARQYYLRCAGLPAQSGSSPLRYTVCWSPGGCL